MPLVWILLRIVLKILVRITIKIFALMITGSVAFTITQWETGWISCLILMDRVVIVVDLIVLMMVVVIEVVIDLGQILFYL